MTELCFFQFMTWFEVLNVITAFNLIFDSRVFLWMAINLVSTIFRSLFLLFIIDMNSWNFVRKVRSSQLFKRKKQSSLNIYIVVYHSIIRWTFYRLYSDKKTTTIFLPYFKSKYKFITRFAIKMMLSKLTC